MNEEIKAEWVRRLRSGEIEQAKGYLGDAASGARCCLGVLCDIAVERGVIEAPEITDGDIYVDMLVYDTCEQFLPPRVQEWAGVADESPWVKGRGLADLNDSGFTFAQIANLIEIYL